MEISEARELKALEEDNRKLKKLLWRRCWTPRRWTRCAEKMYDPPRPCKGRFVVTVQSAQMYPASREW